MSHLTLKARFQILDTSSCQSWRTDLSDHLRRLSPESRLKRFLTSMPDQAVHRYAAKADPSLIVFALVEDEIRACAEVHLDRANPKTAEIALSVEDSHQNHGLGSTLLDLARAECAGRGIEEVFLYFSNANTAMGRLSLHAGFDRHPSTDGVMAHAPSAPALAA